MTASATMNGLLPGEKERLKEMLEGIRGGDLEGMVLERLKQRDDIFRIRSGNLRLLYRKEKMDIAVLALERQEA